MRSTRTNRTRSAICRTQTFTVKKMVAKMLPSQAEWERKQICLERVMRIKNEKKKTVVTRIFEKKKKG